MRPRLDKAVILAAGRGNRLSAAARGVPKPLLSLDGTGDGLTFLDWHLRALRAAGVRDIFLVGNRATFGTRLRTMDEIPATWILNPTEDLSESGSAHSWALAIASDHGILDGSSRVVLMDADIVYAAELFERLAGEKGALSKILVCPDHRATDEEVLVFADPRRSNIPQLQGKGLTKTPFADHLTCIGEATGVLVWEPPDHDAVRSITQWTMTCSTAKTRSEHEDVTGLMMRLGRVEAVLLPPGFPFMEVDTPEEYRAMTSRLYPRIVAHEKARQGS